MLACNSAYFSEKENNENQSIFLHQFFVCSGLRMGKMQTKVGLVFMLQDFTYNLVNKDELKLSAKSFVVQPNTGINLRISKRIK